MPRKRRVPKTRHRQFVELPDCISWWLLTGDILNMDECRAAGFDDPSDAAWALFVLHYADEPAGAGPHTWTRQRLRAAGYGAEVDAIEERERAEVAPDAA